MCGNLLPLTQFLKSQKKTNSPIILSSDDQSSFELIFKDALDFEVGTVLQHIVNDLIQPLTFFSRQLKPAERRYSNFDRERLAIFNISSRVVPLLSSLIINCSRLHYHLNLTSAHLMPFVTWAIFRSSRMTFVTFRGRRMCLLTSSSRMFYFLSCCD